jgi:DNA-binding PadR family transcriptional regulator
MTKKDRPQTGRGLGEFEQLILLALVALPQEQAYGVPIREKIEQRTGKAVSTGAVYTALERLASRGLITSELGEPTSERGGRRKRLYRLEYEGARLLAESLRTITDMSRGLMDQLEVQLAAGGQGARSAGSKRQS